MRRRSRAAPHRRRAAGTDRAARNNAAVLVAPPGAGKTTRVPLVLAEEPWAEQRRILVLEPRRLAARAAADAHGEDARRARRRHASACGCASARRFRARTRIEIVTEGVFTRLSSTIPSSTASPPCCSTNSTSARSMPISAWRWRATCSRACAKTCGSWSCRRRIDGARVAALLGHAPVIDSRRPRLSGRDPLCRPRCAADRAADRRRDRARDACRPRLAAGVPSRRRRNPPHPGAARRPARADMRCRRALRRARRRRAGPRHRPCAARPPQSRAGHLDRRDLDHHRGRAHRRRQRARPRAALRTRCRRDAARDRARLARGGRPAPRPRRPHRAGHLLPAVGRAADRGARSLIPARKSSPPTFPVSRSTSPPGAPSPEKLAFLDPPPHPALAEARTLLVELGAIDADGRITEEGRATARGCRCRRGSRAWWSTPRAEGAALLAAEIAVLIGERGLGGDDADLPASSRSLARATARRARAMPAPWRNAGRSTREGDGRELRLRRRTSRPP